MSFHDYTPVMNLNTSKIRWTIRVRAQAIWRGVNKKTQQFKGINVLFFDDSKCRIHAFINAKYADLFENKLEEGGTYKISNFVVKEYVGHETNRCLRNPKHLYFAAFTKVETDLTYRLTMPQHSFDLSDLMDVPQFEIDTRYLCDVVGVITQGENIVEYLNDRNEIKVQKNFSITDGRYTLKVTFFDQFAKKFEADLTKLFEGHHVVVIMCAKAHKFQGEVYLTNYPATRYYLDPDHYAVNDLLIKAADESFFHHHFAKEHNDDVQNNLFLTVQAIKDASEDYVGKEVTCEVTVKHIQEQHPWYIYVCNVCEQELVIVDDRYKCPFCERKIPFPDKRFQLHALCSDNKSDITIIFPDREVRRITGKNVFEVALEDTQPNNYPPLLRDIELQTYTVTLIIDKENVNKASTVYTAIQVVEGSKIVAPTSPSIDSFAESNQNINETEIHTPEILQMEIDYQTPSPYKLKEQIVEAITATRNATITKTSGMKTRARKNTDKEKEIAYENTMLNNIKPVKIEKVFKKRG